MLFYTYIIYNPEYDKFYIGQTYSLKKRIKEHKEGSGKYTSKYGKNWMLVYYEKFNTRAEAMCREKQLKQIKNKNVLKQIIHTNKCTPSSVG